MITFLTTFLCFFLGSIFGNISTSFFFRIPRNIPLNGLENPPMCSNCKAKLKYPYYIPYFCFLFKSGKCYSCKIKVPIIYTLIEFISGIFCAVFFFFYPITQANVMKLLAIILIFIVFLLYKNHQKFYEKINWFLLTLGLMFNFYLSSTLIENEIGIKILSGGAFALLIFIINKRIIEIEEICFYICVALFFESTQIFFITSVLSLALKIFSKTPGIFLLPFLTGILF